MNLQFFQPHPALQGFVNNIMICQIDFDSSKPRPVFPFPPLPEHSLFFYPYDRMDIIRQGKLNKQRVSRCVIVGPTTHQFKMIPGYHHLVIKAGFQPGGLYRLLGIPMQQLLGEDGMDADILFGNEINTTCDQLQEAVSFEQMKKIIEYYLLTKVNNLKASLPIDPVLNLLLKEGGLFSIDSLSSAACLSNRQFERLFKDRMGLSPKFFSRLVRFARAWVIKENQPAVSWLKIAHECGYYDQMHLIHDFNDFAGVNPSEVEAEFQQAPVSLKNRIFY